MNGDLNKSTDVIVDYIRFCQGLCIPCKDVVVYSNDKAWFDQSIRSKLIDRERAFQSGDQASYKKDKYEVRSAIKLAKKNYSQRLESNLQATNDSRQLWQQVKQIVPYKSKSNSNAIPYDPELPDKLNEFYSRFDQGRVPLPRSHAMIHPSL